MSQSINFERFNRLSADLQIVTVYNGDIVHCNPAAQLLFNQAGKEQSPATIFDFVSADEHHFFSFQLAQSAASGVGNKFLTRYASASGIRWLLWHTDIDQSNEHMYWIGLDVTELKRSTVSLEILEEVTATGVWELDNKPIPLTGRRKPIRFIKPKASTSHPLLMMRCLFPACRAQLATPRQCLTPSALHHLLLKHRI